MTSRGVRSALVFTLAVALAAALLGEWADGRFSWGPPEKPKAQCEALDAATLPPLVKDALARAYHARVAAAVVREPQNTWSNLAFVFAGALVFTRDRRGLARLLGAALVALGLASGLYHASLVPLWRTVDVAAMGWVSFALVCVGAVAVSPRLAALGPTTQLSLATVGSTLAMLAAVFRNDVRLADVKPFDSTYTTVAGITAVFLLLAAGLLLAARKPLPTSPTRLLRPLLLRLSVLALVVAVAAFCQLNDRPGLCLCAPGAALQGHAAWHVLMAAAVLLAHDLFALLAPRPES